MDTDEGNHEEPSKSASEVKLSKSKAATTNGEVPKLSWEDRTKGYRLIDLECLDSALRNVHKCTNGGLTVIEDERRFGLCSTLQFMCTTCGKMTSMATSKQREGRGNSYDVNRRAAFAMCELGKGCESMADFCTVMDMPPPTESKGWADHNKAIMEAALNELEKELTNAGKRLREHLMKEDETITDTSTLDVTVSYDGSWQHRGFKSSHGFGAVMSVDTGEIVDVVPLSKDCEDCAKHSQDDPDNDDFQIWEYDHHEGGKCQHNFDGPSTSMETEAARIAWGRSEELHNMRYTVMLSDGDSKTLTNLNNEKPYGENVVIDKIDCVNHVHKRMGKGLRNLRKTCSSIKGGRGGLTDPMITKLTEYYRSTIMSNTTKSKDPADILNAVAKMEKAIKASLYHNVAHRNLEDQHQYCPDDSWCKYRNDKKNGTQTYDSGKAGKLPYSFLEHMLPLYNRLSSKDLLQRCVPGQTQNQNESFNSTVWKRCPKEMYFGAKAFKRGLSSAVMSWNVGTAGRARMMKRMKLHVGPYSEVGFLRKDYRRLSDAIKKASEKHKAARKRAKLTKQKDEEKKRRRDGINYSPGME